MPNRFVCRRDLGLGDHRVAGLEAEVDAGLAFRVRSARLQRDGASARDLRLLGEQ